MINKNLVIIRGGGDLATGVIQKFHRVGLDILVLEVSKPMAIRRTVALSDAVYFGSSKVEDVSCTFVDSLDKVPEVFAKNEVAMIVDPEGKSINELKPIAVIDAILAKKNLGTNKNMAPITIALGPGFTANEDVNIVIETVRGHNLGRLIFEGQALPNTGIPGVIGGKGAQRVIHAPIAGKVKLNCKFGDVVEEGKPILFVNDTPCNAPFTGLIRGLIPDGFEVPKGMKIGDIDPRLDVDCFTISDKARCLGGCALEAFYYSKNKLKENI